MDHSMQWGSIQLQPLPKEIDVQRLRQCKPVFADEPLMLSRAVHAPDVLAEIEAAMNSRSVGGGADRHNMNRSCQPIAGQLNHATARQSSNNKINGATFQSTVSDGAQSVPVTNARLRLRPCVDSYIVNTIKLNRILHNKDGFDEAGFFARQKKNSDQSDKKQTPRQKKHQKTGRRPLQLLISSDEDAQLYLRQFITIMCIHCGFDEASSVSLDILVDLLDHFIDSFFSLLKNLRGIYQFDVRSAEPAIGNCYSSELFIEQALLESGIGTISEIKEFYVNDIINYYRQTYKKVSKLHADYKARRLQESLRVAKSRQEELHSLEKIGDHEHDIKIDEFMKDNDFLNDETNSILGDLLTDLNVTHFDEEMNKLLQIIGPDPFSLITDDFQVAD